MAWWIGYYSFTSLTTIIDDLYFQLLQVLQVIIIYFPFLCFYSITSNTSSHWAVNAYRFTWPLNPWGVIIPIGSWLFAINIWESLVAGVTHPHDTGYIRRCPQWQGAYWSQSRSQAICCKDASRKQHYVSLCKLFHVIASLVHTTGRCCGFLKVACNPVFSRFTLEFELIDCFAFPGFLLAWTSNNAFAMKWDKIWLIEVM